MLIFAEDCFISAEDSSKLDILHSICLSLQKIAASQQKIQASLIFSIRFATSLQKIAASQQCESRHRGTNDEKILKT